MGVCAPSRPDLHQFSTSLYCYIIKRDAKQIENVKLAVLLYERRRSIGKKRKSDFHVSLRSDGGVNVAAIATSFGGGGHQNAAGFDIHATLPELKRTIFYFSENL